MVQDASFEMVSVLWFCIFFFCDFPWYSLLSDSSHIRVLFGKVYTMWFAEFHREQSKRPTILLSHWLHFILVLDKVSHFWQIPWNYTCKCCAYVCAKRRDISNIFLMWIFKVSQVIPFYATSFRKHWFVRPQHNPIILPLPPLMDDMVIFLMFLNWCNYWRVLPYEAEIHYLQCLFSTHFPLKALWGHFAHPTQ